LKVGFLGGVADDATDEMNTCLVMYIPAETIGTVIGKAGANIKAMQKASGVTDVRVQRAEPSPESLGRTVMLFGTSKCCTLAAYLIQRMLLEKCGGVVADWLERVRAIDAGGHGDGPPRGSSRGPPQGPLQGSPPGGFRGHPQSQGPPHVGPPAHQGREQQRDHRDHRDPRDHRDQREPPQGRDAGMPQVRAYGAPPALAPSRAQGYTQAPPPLLYAPSPHPPQFVAPGSYQPQQQPPQS
jgi:hypothetical protein